ncbi:aminopeptidase P family protein [Kordiimonas sp. SCSIO 12603]|uniref:M24 family metallopeptidase n=1 Tax=Kordiimonas sp. SCSIO 12603 TaxID=2829596 RepID=UPI002106FEAA|nr:Xaa-Pro peptidase family protein [Kordiimonas sp. SCSIO 12603]UTW59366.1 aminopeptidase P family protein [Kordiimonas sp. SCSIO 12603]
MDKRDFLKLAGAGLGAAALVGTSPASGANKTVSGELENITGDAKPISTEERKARVAKAQKLMREKGIDAILLEPGSAMLYFTGIRWWRSERLTCVVIPREGEIGVVTPYFEEPSVRESMTFGSDVRAWHEHENPFERVAGILKDRGITSGKIGFESTVRFFIMDGFRKAASQYEVVSADPITLGCRMHKSKAELKLMHKANEITLRAYGEVWDKLEKGMTPDDIKALMRKAQADLGGSGIWGLALLGEASAYPHGTDQPQELTEGKIVLMDCGCSVHGYQSDISRTFVFGEASKRQREVWDTVRKGQDIAFETAKLGTPAGHVDDAVRRYYESKGYGPGYKTPGLSHRTGHGIGMDGHESVNFVHGETTKLAPGMCFSNEPGIYIFGEFGVRLEDCIYMTENGPQWFTKPPQSIEQPVGKLGPKIP